MGRKKRNKYRLKTQGVIITQSIEEEVCRHYTDREIIETILTKAKFFEILKAYQTGRRGIQVIPIKVHPIETE